MTSQQIAENFVVDFMKEHDTALGAGAWIDKARAEVNDCFHMARDNKKSVTAVVKELVKESEKRSKRFTEIMCDYVIGKVLGDWLCYGWLTEQEKRTARKILN